MSVQLIENEYGVRFVLGTSFDMSANTDLQFHFIKPDCISELFVDGVLGTSPITTDAGIFAANEWAYYDFVDGDLDQASDDANQWRADLRYQGPNSSGSPVIASAQLFSEPVSFEVDPALVAGTP